MRAIWKGTTIAESDDIVEVKATPISHSTRCARNISNQAIRTPPVHGRGGPATTTSWSAKT